MLVLQSDHGSGLVHLSVEAIQLLGGGLERRRRGRGRAADEWLGRGRLAEVVDAGVVGVTLVVFHVREGGLVGRDVAGVDISVAWVVAVRGERGRLNMSTVPIQCLAASG